MIRPLTSIALTLVLGACEEDAEDPTCTISSTLAGDVVYTLPGPDDVACLTQFSSDEGVDVEYATFNERSLRVDLRIGAVTRGMRGAGYPAEVRVHDAGFTVASLACTVDIDEHVLVGPVEFGESWQIRGAGRCDGPLTDEGGKSVTIAPFEFAARVTWTD